jgi:hypothetical protein
MSIFLVQVFEAGPSGQLKYLPVQEAPSPSVAIRRAEKAAESAAGAVAVRRDGDADSGEYSEPVVLARFGEVPREFA